MSKVNKDLEKGNIDTTADVSAQQPSQAVIRGQKRMQQTQAQVDEVTEIMRVNVEKVIERDGMISGLGERADALKEGAEMFEKQAGALKSKFWYENLKMLVLMGVVAVLFIVFLIFCIN